MKNRVNIIVIISVLFLLIFLLTNGVKIGNFEILPIAKLLEKNDFIISRVNDLNVLSENEYPNSIEKLEETYSTYLKQKEKYDDLVFVANKNNIYETKQYDMGYLWEVLGKYATKRNLTLELNVEKNKKTGNVYNLNFTVQGYYTQVISFITDLENDSDLNFRIYNFNMNGKKVTKENLETGERWQETITEASFKVKGINLNPNSISK